MQEFINKDDTQLNASAASLKTALHDDTYNEFLNGIEMGPVDKSRLSELNESAQVAEEDLEMEEVGVIQVDNEEELPLASEPQETEERHAD